MTLIVDDAALLAVLAEAAPEDIAEAVGRGEVFTTGCWYWRLSRALGERNARGSLSRLIGALNPQQRESVVASVDRLPPQIGLLSLRDLVPVMTALANGAQLNLLTAEAVAAAVTVGATIHVTTDSALLNQTCARVGVEVRRLPR